MSTKSHWEKIYSEKSPQEVSWTQEIPETSIEFFNEFKLSKTSPIIDIGGGESKFVDFLLAEGYQNISVLDISENAINRAKQRLGNIDEKVKWVISDITNFLPEKKYDVWHDRAVFHFLTEQKDIAKYKTLVNKSINDYFVLATFSDEGPNKCSGLEICKYSELDLKNQFDNSFKVIESFKKNHSTPFNTTQNFTFSVFQKQY